MYLPYPAYSMVARETRGCATVCASTTPMNDGFGDWRDPIFDPVETGQAAAKDLLDTLAIQFDDPGEFAAHSASSVRSCSTYLTQLIQRR